MSLPAVVGAHPADGSADDEPHVGLVIPEEYDQESPRGRRGPSEGRPSGTATPRPAPRAPGEVRDILGTQDRPPAAVGEAIRELHRIEREGPRRSALESRVKSVPRIAATKMHRALLELAAENTGQTTEDLVRAVVEKVEATGDRRNAFKEVLAEAGVDKEDIRRVAREMHAAKRPHSGDSGAGD